MAVAQRHKSFPLITPTNNRYLAFKWDSHKYDVHRNRIANIRSTVDTRPPVTARTIPPTAPSRKSRISRERNSQIENENVKLLKKMVRINETGGRVDNRNQNQFSRSLNSWKRKQELDRIERENISILKRIALREPEYDQRLFEEDWLVHDQLSAAVARYPRRWWEFPKKSAPDLDRPNTGSHTYMRRRRSQSTSSSRPNTSAKSR
ncbi:Oidioi.mRNA.OKI2018_I69.chr1.g155.t1.cds [Oikopleura dioica]|uniref:Oidioi.mRNA.OKI2018_I69.chr1.g155.t1.cds n=1 Tax=Oikopleura dioica TaxID=34765 RepID=A0ABN7SIZ0_OIKDI|nr:Oidioi.mRNA.OKI2018_I69.chr1.g155.t1.cds [Oikopleura dioica]